MVYVDEEFQNMIFYECEHELPSGHCAPDATFVIWYSRSPIVPDEALTEKIRNALIDVCVQPGDLVAVSHDPENGAYIHVGDVRAQKHSHTHSSTFVNHSIQCRTI